MRTRRHTRTHDDATRIVRACRVSIRHVCIHALRDVSNHNVVIARTKKCATRFHVSRMCQITMSLFDDFIFNVRTLQNANVEHDLMPSRVVIVRDIRVFVACDFAQHRAIAFRQFARDACARDVRVVMVRRRRQRMSIFTRQRVNVVVMVRRRHRRIIVVVTHHNVAHNVMWRRVD